jgi:hypothetical protein
MLERRFGRRSFLIGCVGMVAAPAFAHLAPPLTGRRPPQSRAGNSPGSTLAAVASPESFVLRIDGWDTPAESGPARHGEVWIHINSSWRCAWR